MTPEWYRPNENGGLCHCGCGQETAVAQRNLRRDGYLKGKRRRYMVGHARKVKKGNTRSKSPSWKGGRLHQGGYIFLYAPNHPYASQTGYVREHRLVMERVYGRYLEPGEEVHHLNGDKKDNRSVNLEVLPASAHRQITRRKAMISPEGFEWKVVW